jgi:hypothetical protein
MVRLKNNFDTGPDGTTITTSNSGLIPGNDGFNIVGGSGAGSVTQYSSAFSRQTAAYTAHLATAAVSSAPCVGWSTSMGSQSQIWFREYVMWTAYPSGITALTIFECDNGSVYNAFVVLQGTTGILTVQNGPQTVTSDFTNPVALNQWYRLECRFQFSTTTGNWEAQLFDAADSDTPLETISASGWNLGAASSNSFVFGYAFGRTNQPDMYISGLELNNTGYPGPAPFRQGLGSPMGNLANPIAVHSDIC